MAITRAEFEKARARTLEYFSKAHIALTDNEKRNLEIADFGLSDLPHYGVELAMYVNTARVCGKEVILFPWQICPEHRHPDLAGAAGKEETFRCRWGTVYLYVDGPATKQPMAKVPENRKNYHTVWHEVILHPGEQFTVPGNQLHWFQGGEEGAVLSEFSTPSTDEDDVFTDPEVKRIPVVI
jgi:D-lyxose ketol-isomerase